ncbi:putative thiamine transport system permease protein [Alteromonas sp. 38]|uniref:ABC transporter permease n=1 Tax=unclassified Alteromonas TaxID=2614992 RepID=UPI0012F168DE|nr:MULTISPECIES: ABC transporter permease subunit [unclassified Alteromonas]CAD5272590.1 putative thiamine transport system permease protein [Alteromonas sp. 154]VXB52842.1 putative thiamine transport system permease protein [Alteromonas sp. 38]
MSVFSRFTLLRSMTLFQRITLSVRVLLVLLLSLPVLAGLVGVMLPAFGYFPALDAHDFTFTVFAQLLAIDGMGKMVLLSFITGLSATVISVASAFLLLAVFYRSAYLNKLQTWLSPLLVLPHAAAAIALLFVLSPSGFFSSIAANFSNILSSIGTDEAASVGGASTLLPPMWAFPYDSYGISIIIALALKELPFVFLMAITVMSQPHVKRKFDGYFKSATALGYSPVTVFFKVIFPTVYPQARLPILAVLAYATANVEIPLLLGPNNPPTLAVAVVQWFNHVDLSMRFQASAAALLQVAVTLVALCVWVVGEHVAKYAQGHFYSNGFRHTGQVFSSLLAYAIVAVYAVIVLSIIVSTVLWSFASFWQFPAFLPAGLTLLHWKTTLWALAEPFNNTLLLATLVSGFSVIVAIMALEAETVSGHGDHNSKPTSYFNGWSGALLSLTLFLPLLVPGVAFLYGLVWFQLAYFNEAVWFHLFISHLVYVLPYVFISLAVAYRKFDPRYAQVAYGMGKTPWQVFVNIKLPLLLAPILVAFALGLAISFSQYLPTLLSTGGRIATVTTEAVAAASGSSARLTAVYVIVQTLMPLLGFVLAWWLPTVCFNPMGRYSLLQTRKSKL